MESSPLAGRGVGVAWRPPLGDWLVERTQDAPHPFRFSEVVAENVSAGGLPTALTTLVARGAVVVPHGVGLGLAGAELPDPGRLAHLAALAGALGAPVVSEHVAFVRAGAPGPEDLHADVLEAGHLVPAPRTRDALDVLVENVRAAQDALPVPLALENVAATLAWPEDELDEPAFLTELAERTGCWVLLDVANLYATCRAHGGDPHALLARMPLERVAYAHVAGGAVQHGVYLDTHAHPAPEPVLDLVTDLLERTGPHGPPLLLERDEDVSVGTVAPELAALRARLPRSPSARTQDAAPAHGPQPVCEPPEPGASETTGRGAAS